MFLYFIYFDVNIVMTESVVRGLGIIEEFLNSLKHGESKRRKICSEISLRCSFWFTSKIPRETDGILSHQRLCPSSGKLELHERGKEFAGGGIFLSVKGMG